MQLDFEGRDRVEVAIDRLRFHEPPEGYYLAFSGGKDSTVIYELAKLAGVKFDAHYHQTGIDPPELVQHIRTHYPDIAWERRGSVWQSVGMPNAGGMPTRTRRWCCGLLKEAGAEGRIVVDGVRWQESQRRRQRQMFELCRKDETKRYLHPIIDWSSADVWSFIKERQLPYCSLYDEGFTRLGCVLCPSVEGAALKQQMERWPKMVEGWRRAAYRYWERHTPGTARFATPEVFWQWWISREGAGNAAQCVMFE